jgi:hypothetical protein
MLVPVCQREKNKKHRWSQGEQALQIIRNAIGRRHDISDTDISAEDILSRAFFVTGARVGLRSGRACSCREQALN